MRNFPRLWRRLRSALRGLHASRPSPARRVRRPRRLSVQRTGQSARRNAVRVVAPLLPKGPHDNNHSRERPRPPRLEPTAMLRWDFLRGHKAVTCEVRATGASSYDVCVIPHWDVSSSVVERFAHPVAALRRHAQIASDFQQAGFSVSRTPAFAVRKTEVPR
jgi:hypothetical protein